MWCYAGNPVDLDDTNWRITPVDTNAKDSLNPEALHGGRHRCRPAASRGQLRASGSTGWGLAEAVQVHNLCSLPGLSGSVHSPSASQVSTLGKWALFTHRARRPFSASQNDHRLGVYSVRRGTHRLVYASIHNSTPAAGGETPR